MLLTTYFGNMKKIPTDYTEIIITRFPPKWLDTKLYRVVVELSPTPNILFKYKENGDWGVYVREFELLMETDSFNRLLKRLAKSIKEGKKFCLVCYEKDYLHCHRYLIAQKIKMDYGIEWEEIGIAKGNL